MRTILTKFHSEAVSLTAGAPKVLNGTGADRPTPRLSLMVSSATLFFVGGPDVNATNGFPVPAAQTFSFDSTDGLYAFSASAITVSILEGF